MKATRPKFVLCWHMHQPWYREGLDGDYRLPWACLHAMKDYADMAAHLEKRPRMRAVVNFTPVLLEQLDDYAARLSEWLDRGTRLPEPLLNVLAGVDPVPANVDARADLVLACSRSNERNMIDALPAYRELLNHALSDAGAPRRALLRYLDEQYFLDLVTWYHLSWIGSSLKSHAPVRSLLQRREPFDDACRRDLLSVMRDTMASLIPRYRVLADRGQVELSMTPYAHPLVPLLIDFDAMACSQGEAPRPASAAYPGGEQRARWHLEHGLAVFESHFGRRPSGVWLSEGGISDAAVRMLDEYGIAWTASGEGVWVNTMSGQQAGGADDRRSLFKCHQLTGCDVRVFFRDDGLSDLIGFEYQQWDAREAAADFVKHLRNIAEFIDGDDPGDHVISVILDGENAWEYYPDNANAFIDAFYEELLACEAVEISTFAETAPACAPHALESLCAGSWVHGSFSTWIGERDKNRAWDCLVEAKQCYDATLARHPEALDEALERQLAICEGSDWFWWFGDDNRAGSVRDFDRLFRRQIAGLYRMLGVDPPIDLSTPIDGGGGGGEAAPGGAMRRGRAHQPA